MGLPLPRSLPGRWRGLQAQCVTFDSPVYKVYIYSHLSLNKVLSKKMKQQESGFENSDLNAVARKQGR